VRSRCAGAVAPALEPLASSPSFFDPSVIND
jgi:hypothetical protein